ncbi:hypothetical protein LPB67_01360 [Undibacterium sp. Jales W-56]|uniref:hypothetical protein n=1 Tax=Undibacterium sp. Jales W-56 TaxID=2897325 RepID=UPI0021D0EBF4|nr:hypothetical protein [Undibacterium sp. Jales W-56]MCU6432423.1 hypothetical protein [Undibacterium sp. Jales W-56]
MKNLRICLLFSVASISACQAFTPQPDVPARLLAMNTGVKQELQKEVAGMLGLPSVSLADNTLLDSSQFAFVRTPRYDESGQLLQGRVIEPPAHLFKLVIRGKDCWLLYKATSQHPAKESRLSLAACKPE